MIISTQKKIFTLKRVKFHDLSTLFNYLSIRYKVFIEELGRPIFGEFNKEDFFAEHYILIEKNDVIGTVRILYQKNNVVIIGRVAILNNFRKQGFGSIIVSKAIELIRRHNKANTVRLYTENEKVNFYKKLRFEEQCIAYFDGLPYVQMYLNIGKINKEF